jgi:hypothetical protein
MSYFDGQYDITGLDALTVLVRLSCEDPKAVRVMYLRRLGNTSSSSPQQIDQCAHCMIRSYQMIADAQDLDLIVRSMGRGKTVVQAIEPYKPGEVCRRCTEHRSLFSFTDRLLGGTE